VALLALSIFALLQWGIAEQETVRANDNANTAVAEQVRADNNAVTAQANEKIAIENEAIANENARAANALALAAEAVNQKDSDTQLSLMLSLLSIQETQVDDFVLSESQSALFSSLNTPNVLYTWEIGSIVSAVAYDPEGKYLAIGNVDGLAQVVDAISREPVYGIQFGDVVSGLSFSPDGERLGISSEDGAAKVVDVKTGDELYSLAGHDGYPVLVIKFSPDGNLIATGGADWNVKIWNAGNGSVQVTLPSHTDSVTSIAFSPDSLRLVSGSLDDTVILWDLETSSLMNKFRPDGFNTDGNQINSVAFNPWGDSIIASGLSTVVVWNYFDYAEIQRLRGNRANVYSVAYAPDGLSMLTASAGVKIWDYYLGTERYNLSSHRGEVTAATYSQDGNFILTGSWDGTAKLWAANLLVDNLKVRYNGGVNTDANYSPDGEYFVVSDSGGGAVLYGTQTGEVVGEWGTDAWVSEASFNPNNPQQIVTSDINGKVIVWEVGRADPVFSIQVLDGYVNMAEYSPDGSMILSASDDGVVRMWDAQNGNLLREITRDGGLRLAKFSEDGSQIIAADWDKTAYLFDANSGEQLLELNGHKDQILAFAFSHDGSYIYTAGYDSTIRKWDAATGDELLVMNGHTGRVPDLDVSPDDKLLVSASADTTVKVWDTESGKEIFDYLGNNEDSNSVAFSPDGKNVLTASSDETTKEFTIHYDTLLDIAQYYELRPLTLEECQRFVYRDDCTLTLFGTSISDSDVSSAPAVQATPTPVDEVEHPDPTPTSVPTVAPSPDEAFYTEEFDGSLDAWIDFMVTGLDNQVSTSIEDSSLFVELSPFEDKLPRYYILNDAFTYSEVQIEAVVTNIGNNANGVSLICQYTDDGWYEFRVSNAGLYSIDAYDPSNTSNQGYMELAAGGSAAIKSGQSTNTYTAICSGSELSLIINGALVNTVSDTSYQYSEGNVGIGISSPNLLPVDVSFESFSVSSP
jgi:WD40 repeat protein